MNLFEDFLREKLYLKNLSAKTRKSYMEAYVRYEKSGESCLRPD